MSTKPAARPEDPRRLDLRTVARLGSELAGELPQAALPRLALSVDSGDAGQTIAWSARGELRPVLGAPPQVWLHLTARTQVQLVCQRCLQALIQPLVLERSVLFVPDETEATRLDEELEEDVLVLPRLFDLVELLEDELILALPIVPRHDVCHVPLTLSTADMPAVAAEDVPAHPFAALAALKKPHRPN